MLLFAFLCLLPLAWGQTDLTAACNAGTVEGAPLSNGVLLIGVACYGHLNIDYQQALGRQDPLVTLPPNSVPLNTLGLRFVRGNGDEASGVDRGCRCEGWGVAEGTAGFCAPGMNHRGFADGAEGNSNNAQLISFTNSSTSITSIVQIGNVWRVTHTYSFSAVSPNAIEVQVQVDNISPQPRSLLYRRKQDWDVDDTAFREYVTLNCGAANVGGNLISMNNNGFFAPDPCVDRSPLSNPAAECIPGGSVQNSGNTLGTGGIDQGALFDFGFPELPPGGSRTFRTHYGATASTSETMTVLGLVGAEVFALGLPENPDGSPATNGPNTFFFAFSDIGGDEMTAAPTTEEPTTEAPTTEEVTTAEVTTPEPTTTEEVTTTEEMTTEEPTTFMMAPTACMVTPTDPLAGPCNSPINILPAGSPEVPDWSSLFVPIPPATQVGSSVTRAGVTFTVTDGTNPYDMAGSSDAWVTTGLTDNGSSPDYVAITVTGLPVGSYDAEVWTYDAANPTPHSLYWSQLPPNPNLPPPSGANTAAETPVPFLVVSTDAAASYQLAAQSTVASAESIMNAFRLQLRDEVNPTVDCQAPNPLSLDDQCRATYSAGCPQAADNCGGATLTQIGGLMDQQVFTGPTIASDGYVVTDAAGNTDQCTYNLVVVDDTPPQLTGSCPATSVALSADQDQCYASLTLPTLGLTVSDNCNNARLVYFTRGVDSSFPDVRGEYVPGTTIQLPVGSYDIVIAALQPAEPGSPRLLSTLRCEIPVVITDDQPPEVCIPSHDVTLPCGGRALAGWEQQAGWAVVKDNCGFRRGTFGSLPSDEQYCGESPVRLSRQFGFRDFGGNRVRTGNVHFDTADSSCTCDYIRPFEYFDTAVATNGNILPAVPDPFTLCSNDRNCWCRTGSFQILGVTDGMLSANGPLAKRHCRNLNRGILLGVLEWARCPEWFTSTGLSACLRIPGTYEPVFVPPCNPAPPGPGAKKRGPVTVPTVAEFHGLESPLLPFRTFYDFITGLTQPILWDQKVEFGSGQDFSFAYVSFFFNCRDFRCRSGLQRPRLIWRAPIPAFYIESACEAVTPFGPAGPVLWVGDNECSVSLSTSFWPDLIEYIEYVNGPGKRGEMSEASLRFKTTADWHKSYRDMALKHNEGLMQERGIAGPGVNLPDLSMLPTEFLLLNEWTDALSELGLEPIVQRLGNSVIEFIRRGVDVKLNFGVAVNGRTLMNELVRSAPLPPPPVVPQRAFYVDTIRFGNTGYRYNITNVSLMK